MGGTAAHTERAHVFVQAAASHKGRRRDAEICIPTGTAPRLPILGEVCRITKIVSS